MVLTDVDKNIIGETFFTQKLIKNMRLKGIDRIKSEVVKNLNGYGERWYYGLGWSVVIIFICALFYMTGLQVNETLEIDSYLIKYICTIPEFFSFNWIVNIDWLQWFKHLSSSLYFSMMTFTTVGYGNIQAIGGVSHFISFIQMFFGVILMTVTTGTLLRKIFR